MKLARRLDRYLRDPLSLPALSLRHLSFEFGISESYVCRQCDGLETTVPGPPEPAPDQQATRLIESTTCP